MGNCWQGLKKGRGHSTGTKALLMELQPLLFKTLQFSSSWPLPEPLHADLCPAIPALDSLPENICSFPEISLLHSHHWAPSLLPSNLRMGGTCEPRWMSKGSLAPGHPCSPLPQKQHPESADSKQVCDKEENCESDTPSLLAQLCDWLSSMPSIWAQPE